MINKLDTDVVDLLTMNFSIIDARRTKFLLNDTVASNFLNHCSFCLLKDNYYVVETFIR